MESSRWAHRLLFRNCNIGDSAPITTCSSIELELSWGRERGRPLFIGTDRALKMRQIPFQIQTQPMRIGGMHNSSREILFCMVVSTKNNLRVHRRRASSCAVIAISFNFENVFFFFSGEISAMQTFLRLQILCVCSPESRVQLHTLITFVKGRRWSESDESENKLELRRLRALSEFRLSSARFEFSIRVHRVPLRCIALRFDGKLFPKNSVAHTDTLCSSCASSAICMWTIPSICSFCIFFLLFPPKCRKNVVYEIPKKWCGISWIREMPLPLASKWCVCVRAARLGLHANVESAVQGAALSKRQFGTTERRIRRRKIHKNISSFLFPISFIIVCCSFARSFVQLRVYFAF